MWHIDVITLYPEIFPGSLLQKSIIGKALINKLWSINVVNLHDFTPSKKIRVDDTPYGGGPGMIIRADVIGNAIDDLLKKRPKDTKIIYMSARGTTLKQETIKRFSQLNNIIILCGCFEGIDQRVIDLYPIEEVSIGDYILSGGEAAAMVVIEACVRLLPGVLGNAASNDEESFAIKDVLEHSQYTKPYNWRGMEVPKVLRSGHHKLIKEWREKDSLIAMKKKLYNS